MTYVQTIQIDELRPGTGSSEGGEQIEIYGSGLASAERVHFGNRTAEFDEDGDARLLAYAPPGRGEVEVYVVDMDGNQSNTMTYRYFD
jgi:hypothetical protein